MTVGHALPVVVIPVDVVLGLAVGPEFSFLAAAGIHVTRTWSTLVRRLVLEGEVTQRVRNQVATKRAKPRTNDTANGTANCESTHPAKSCARQSVEPIWIDVANRIPPHIGVNDCPRRPSVVGKSIFARRLKGLRTDEEGGLPVEG